MGAVFEVGFVVETQQPLAVAGVVQQVEQLILPLQVEAHRCDRRIVPRQILKGLPRRRHDAMDDRPGADGVFEGIGAFPTRPHQPDRLRAVLEQELDHRLAGGQGGGNHQGGLLDALEAAGAVGGAHKQSLAARSLSGVIEGRIAQVAALDLAAAPLTGPEALVEGPGFTHGEQGVNVAKHLNGFGPCREGRRHGRSCPQYINGDRAVGQALVGHFFGSVE